MGQTRRTFLHYIFHVIAQPIVHARSIRVVLSTLTEGDLDQNGQLTELGRYLAREKFDRDEKSRVVHADLCAGTFVLQEQRHSGTA